MELRILKVEITAIQTAFKVHYIEQSNIYLSVYIHVYSIYFVQSGSNLEINTFITNHIGEMCVVDQAPFQYHILLVN